MRFTRFHSNVENNFAGLASSVLKVLQKASGHKIHRENCVLLKICENCESFLSLNFLSLTVLDNEILTASMMLGII